MNFRRFFRSAVSVIFYVAVYTACQMVIGLVISYAVSFKCVLDYLSANSAEGADSLGSVNFYELMQTAETMATELLTNNLFLISIISAVFTLVVYYLIFKLRKKKFTLEVGVCKMSISYYPMMLLLGISLYFLTSMLLSVIPIPEQLMNDYAEASSPLTENAMTFTGILYTVLIAPIFEEVVFRGLIYTRFKRCMPMLGAMILSSFFFGIMHGTSIVWVAYASVLGFFLAWIFEKCGSLLASVTLHAGFNLMGVLAMLLPPDISQVGLLSILAVSAVVSVLLIFVVNKKSKVKIEIGMPEWETENR